MENGNNKIPFILWLTGLSAAGKTTIAQSAAEKLREMNLTVHHLDGDEVRAAAKEKLGFSKEERDKNIRLAIQLAGEYQEKGFSVIASFISPYREHREWGRADLKNYLEVFVHCPLAVCEARDPKGLYKKARAGEIESFTGISDIYEEPENPELILNTHEKPLEECIEEVVGYLRRGNFF